MKRSLIICLLLLIQNLVHCQYLYSETERTIEQKQVAYETFFLNNEKDLAIRMHSKIQVYQVDSLDLLTSLKLESSAMDAMADSNILAIGDQTGSISLFKENTLIKKIKTCNTRIKKVKFSQSPEVLASVSEKSGVQIWHFDKDKPVSEFFPEKGQITDIEFSLDNAYLIISTSLGMVFIWDYQKDIQYAEFKAHKSKIMSLALCPDGLRFASCGLDKKIAIYSIRNRDFYYLEKAHKNLIADIAFINEHFLLSIGHDHRTVLNNIDTTAEKSKNYNYVFRARKVLGDKYLNGITVSNEGKCIAVSTLGNGIFITDYVHGFIEKSHRLIIYDCNQTRIIASTEKDNILTASGDVCNISGLVGRSGAIKKIWLYCHTSKQKKTIILSDKGAFSLSIPNTLDGSQYSIYIQDVDTGLQIVEYKLAFIDTEDIQSKEN